MALSKDSGGLCCVLLVAATILLCAYPGGAQISEAARQASVFAQASIAPDDLPPGGPLVISDFVEDYDAFVGFGSWDSQLEARQTGFETADPGIGQTAVASQISSSRIELSSRVTSTYDERLNESSTEWSYGHGATQLGVILQLSEPTNYTLVYSESSQAGALTPSVLTAGWAGEILLERIDLPVGPPVEIFYAVLGLGPLASGLDSPIEWTGVLEAGTYAFQSFHRADDGFENELQLLFTVPEPSTALLLLLGLAGLAARTTDSATIEPFGRNETNRVFSTPDIRH